MEAAEAAEAAEAHNAFDDVEDRLDGLFALGVAGFGKVGLQLGLHGEAPGFLDLPLSFGWWRGADIIRPARLAAAHCEQRADAARLW
jgi:hypothetical protein